MTMGTLKDVLGPLFEMATGLGEKLGEALNDWIDELIPPTK